VSKSNSKGRIESSIDGILSGLQIRGRKEDKEHYGYQEVEALKQRLAIYETLGSITELTKEREEFLALITQLQTENTRLSLRNEENDVEIQELAKEVEHLRQQKDSNTYEIEFLKQALTNLEQKLMEQNNEHGFDIKTALYQRDQWLYQPSTIIRQYCEQPEGKRKVTIHLREIEYQAILKSAEHFHSSKGQLMETITKALRFYIPSEYYKEAEKEVYQKAITAVSDLLNEMGFSKEDIQNRLQRT
jgi:hypothetical protein